MITQKTVYECICDICGHKNYAEEAPNSLWFSGRFKLIYSTTDANNSTKQVERPVNLCANCYELLNTAINSILVAGD